jgi:hypothetical protein
MSCTVCVNTMCFSVVNSTVGSIAATQTGNCSSYQDPDGNGTADYLAKANAIETSIN